MAITMREFESLKRGQDKPQPGQPCRWFMITILEDLPHIYRCDDCGLYYDLEEGWPITEDAVQHLRMFKRYKDGQWVAKGSHF